MADLNPQQSPGIVPSGGLNVQASPNFFGALEAQGMADVGQATQGFGRVLGATGDTITAVALARAEMTNELLANDANTKAMSRVTQLYEDFNTKEGKAAHDAFPDFQAGLQQIYQDSIDQMPNPQAKSMLSRSLRYVTDNYLGRGISWSNSQFRKWQDDSANNASDEFLSQAAIASDDWNDKDHSHFDTYMASAYDNQLKIWEQKGYSAEDAAHNAKEWAGDKMADIITGVAKTDPAKAQAMFNTYDGIFDAKARFKATSALKSVMLDQQGNQITDDIMQGKGAPPRGEIASPDQIQQLGAEPAQPPSAAPTMPQVPSWTGDINSRAKTLMNMYEQRGMSHVAAAAMAARAITESSLNPRIVNSIGAAGLHQWLGDRRQMLMEYAQANGKDWTDPEVQADFAMHELGRGEKLVGDQLKLAQTPLQASIAAINFERPEGWSPTHPTGGALFDQSYALTQALLEGKDLTGIVGQSVLGANENKTGFAFGNMPNRAWALQQALDRTEGNPQLRNIVLSGIKQQFELADANVNDALKQIEINNKMQQEKSDQVEQDYLKKIYPGQDQQPAPDLQQSIIMDQNLTREAKERLNGLYMASMKGETGDAVSHKNVNGILQGILDGSVNDVGPIYEAKIAGKINTADFNLALGQFKDMTSPEGNTLGKQKASFFGSVKSQFTATNDLLGVGDGQGDQDYYRFQYAVNDKINQYRKEGKDPYDLFNPNKPDFMGSPANVKGFITPLSVRMKNFSVSNPNLINATTPADNAIVSPPAAGLVPPEAQPQPATEVAPTPAQAEALGKATGDTIGKALSAPPAQPSAVNPAPNAIPPSVPKRMPGETIEQYNKRIGGPKPLSSLEDFKKLTFADKLAALEKMIG